MKKIAVTIGAISGTVLFISILALVSLFFYVQSEQFDELVKTAVNDNIPGKMDWSELSISISNGDIGLKNFSLKSDKDEEIISIENARIAIDMERVKKALSVIINSLDFSAMQDQELIIKEIILEKPEVKLAIDSDKNLNILSAFPKSNETSDEKNSNTEPFTLPFRIKLASFDIKQGKFQYRTAVSQEKSPQKEPLSTEGDKASQKGTSENGVAIFIDEMNLHADGEIAPVSKLNLALSFNTAGGEIKLTGVLDNIETGAFGQATGNGSDGSLPGDISNLPTADIKLNADFIMEKFLEMTGFSSFDAKGPVSLGVQVAGSLNDPEVSFRIEYPAKNLKKKNLSASSSEPSLREKDYDSSTNASIAGRIIDDGVIDIAMKNRKIAVNNILIRHPYALLKADGAIDMAEAFPGGFAGYILSGDTKKAKRKPFEEISRLIKGDIHLEGEDINAGKLLESEKITGIKGLCSFEGDLKGGMLDPDISLLFKAKNASYQDYPAIESADFDLKFKDGELAIKKMELSACNSNLEIAGKAKVLEKEADGGFKPLSMPTLDISAGSKKIDIARVLEELKVLPDKKISGTISLKAGIKGSADNPDVVLKLGSSDFKAYDQILKAIDLDASYSNQKVSVNSLKITLPSGYENGSSERADAAGKRASGSAVSERNSVSNEIKLTGWLDKNRKVKAELSSDGVNLSSIEAIKKSGTISGVLSCSVAAEGSLDSIKNMAVGGDLSLKKIRIIDKPVEDFSAKLNLKKNHLMLNGRLNFDIGADFNTESKDFTLKALFDNTELLPWLKFAGVKEISKGTVTGKVDVRGNASSPENISGNCDISSLALNIFKDPAIFTSGAKKKSEELWVRADSIKASIKGKEFTIDKISATLPENGKLDLKASGKIGGSVKTEAHAVLPVKFAYLFVPDNPVKKGVVKLDIKADINPGVSIEESDLDADVVLEGLSVSLPDPVSDLRLDNINGSIKADMRRIEIPDISGLILTGSSYTRSASEKKEENGTIRGKNGEFSLNGKIDLKNLKPENISAKLTAKAIPVTAIDDLDANLDTDLKFTGNMESSRLAGNILINRAVWTGDIHVEKQIFNTITEKKRVRKVIAGNEKASSFLDNMRLNMAVKGKKPVIVDNNVAYMEMHPDIRITGTASSPVISGRSEINPGTITYQSSEFTLTRGIIDFVNPYEIEPDIDIISKRTVRNWEITLAVSGTPTNMNFKLSSEPTLEDGDIISLLLRGKTVSELINAEGGTTLSAAGMLSQVAASAVSDKLKSATGLDIFEVGFGNSAEKNGLEDMNVTVGKELTDKITVKYTTENDEGVIVNKTSAEYKVLDNVSVSGFQDSEGQFGGEIRYRLEFR